MYIELVYAVLFEAEPPIEQTPEYKRTHGILPHHLPNIKFPKKKRKRTKGKHSFAFKEAVPMGQPRQRTPQASPQATPPPMGMPPTAPGGMPPSGQQQKPPKELGQVLKSPAGANPGNPNIQDMMGRMQQNSQMMQHQNMMQNMIRMQQLNQMAMMQALSNPIMQMAQGTAMGMAQPQLPQPQGAAPAPMGGGMGQPPMGGQPQAPPPGQAGPAGQEAQPEQGATSQRRPMKPRPKPKAGAKKPVTKPSARGVM